MVVRLTGTVLAGVAALMVIACGAGISPPAAPQSSSLLGDLDRALAADGAIPWSATRPLVWADFRGPVPASPGQDAARTAYSLPHGARCIGGTFEFQVVAAFLPGRSWVRPAVVADPDESRRALEHEQTHFNLTEVYARRMRRYFAELYDPCGQTEAQWSAAADGLVRQEASAQARYDDETRNGRVADAQARWNTLVADDLVTLARYAGRRPVPPKRVPTSASPGR